MTTDEINRIEETISFHGNNCGGCEACDQVFGSEPLTFDAETVWGLVKTIRSMEAKLKAAEAMAKAIEVSGCSDGFLHRHAREYRTVEGNDK